MNLKAKEIFSKLLPIILGLISGISVFYYLYFFRAYGIQTGISYSGHSHLFRSISFGLLTFLYLSFFESFVKPKISFTRGSHQFFWYLSLTILGSHLIFILFNFFWNCQEWNLAAYLLIMMEFPLMMIFPFVIYFLIRLGITPQKKEPNYIEFCSESGKDLLKIKADDFLYANSAENYISIYYYSNQQKKPHLIRKPLKVLEKELKAHPQIVRCHRGYLVNRENIQNIKQEKGKILLEIASDILSVSKKYQDQFI